MMRKSVVLIAAMTAILTVCASAAVAQQAAKADASLRINAADAGRPISPLLYGIFFEDINHAADGGLYAELIRNRSFEDTVVPERCTVEDGKLKTPKNWTTPFPTGDPMPGWKPVFDGGARGTVRLDDGAPLNAANSRSLRVQVDSADTGRVGVFNEGFWGIPAKAGAEYRFSMYARAQSGFDGAIAVTIESAKGDIYASGEIAGVGTEWKRFETALKCGSDDRNARLVIATRKPGTFWIDAVSLFPKDTWFGRENGLRQDLANMLAEMRPSFVRFPGGCFVEGFTLETALRWKDTIGPVEQRKGHWNLWGYRTTDGLGYHELLQMCEDLKAAPLFVFNCGMTCQGRGPEMVPMEELGPWIQDALDAIEYANGPVDSKWGAVRAAHGHKAPFNLKYMEIGNENWGGEYEERYARFYHAIKEKYPEIQLVANCSVKSAPMDILDEHYYSSPDFFASRVRQYDSYDRKGPKIYVGEYAVTQGCGKGNLRAALGEAAFMTGMEQNGDVVVMSSYAPLFVNVNDRCWNPDAIVYDNNSCYGTPSYHVQKMFSRNCADVALPTTLECESLTPDSHGGIGLGTWNTSAEFKDVQVTGKDGSVLYSSDFVKGASEWKPVRGVWGVSGGAYQEVERGLDFRAVTGDASWKDYVFSVKARKISGEEGFLILFRALDEQNWIWFNAGGWQNSQHGIEQMRNGQKSMLGNRVPGKIETGRWYEIRVEIEGMRIRCFLDGELVQETELPATPVMTVSAGRRKADNAIVIKAVNLSDSAKTVDISLDGAGKIASEGTEEVLNSANPDDENSLADPLKVAPVEGKVQGMGAQFRHAFAAGSVTILTLRSE